MDKKSLQEQFEQTKTYELCKSWQIDFDEKAEIYYSINPAYHNDVIALNAAWSMFQEQQAKVEELQRRNQMLNDNIKEQGQKLVYQNEVIETQAEKLLGLRDEKAELQKRVDELEKHLKPCECGSKEINVDQEGYVLKHCYRCGGFKTQEMIEQALKGEGQ